MKTLTMDFSYIDSKPECTGIIRSNAEDFCVDEILPYDISGTGEHVCLYVQKQYLNTMDVVKQLSRQAVCRQKDIGYGGLKDKNALTKQWFSIYLPGNNNIGNNYDWDSLETSNLKILQQTRHSKKIRKGSHRCNRFIIKVRQLMGGGDFLQQRLETIKKRGVANYFGEQRFGFQGGNLQGVERFFAGELGRLSKFKRGLYLSAARSYLFNWVLSERVRKGLWDCTVDGDILSVNNSHGFFSYQADDDAIPQRLLQGEIHPSGPLWGKGSLNTQMQALELEQQLLAKFSDWCRGLEQTGMKQERRSLRVIPENFRWQLEHDTLVLQFDLPAGSFATSVLREVVDYRVNEKGM